MEVFQGTDAKVFFTGHPSTELTLENDQIFPTTLPPKLILQAKNSMIANNIKDFIYLRCLAITTYST